VTYTAKSPKFIWWGVPKVKGGNNSTLMNAMQNHIISKFDFFIFVVVWGAFFYGAFPACLALLLWRDILKTITGNKGSKIFLNDFYGIIPNRDMVGRSPPP